VKQQINQTFLLPNLKRSTKRSTLHVLAPKIQSCLDELAFLGDKTITDKSINFLPQATNLALILKN
jgi:hypothetical protein